MMSTQTDVTCSRCTLPLGGRPFCMRDGHLANGERFVIGERYMVDELIGGGGFGFVFGGKHLVLGKPVAIKVLRDLGGEESREAKRFLREARNASQLAHENIISILDFGRCPAHGVAYLVMERFVGVMLSDVIREHAPMPVSRVLPILLQLARALSAAHEADVIHRDINPRNILVGRGDLVKLCDFGLSRSLVNSGDRLTSIGAMVGTPAYMAPEQIRDEPIDSRVDVFGFGCTAFEMLTGRVPHGSPTPVGVLANRLAEVTLELGNFVGPIELEALILSCLAPRPDERPSANELEAALVAIASQGSRASIPGISDNRRQIGNYKVVKQLGRGGASSVFLGVHPVIGTKVAIKVLHPEIAVMPGMAERFIMEARTSSELACPNLTHYHDFGTLETGQPYAVLELLEGENVATRLTRTGTFGVAETVEIVRQTARAMEHVHAAGIVHRDLKPDNLFLTHTATGELLVKVLDFGIAKSYVAGSATAQTTVGMVLGTPGYCSPEQAMGLPVGPESDVFALGVTMYVMLLGELPYDAGRKTLPALPGEVPTPIADTLRRMLARSPEDRIATMAEVLEGMSSWVATAEAPTRPEVSNTVAAVPAVVTAMRPTISVQTDRLSTSRHRRHSQLRVAAAAGIAVVIGALVIARYTSSSSPATASAGAMVAPPPPVELAPAPAPEHAPPPAPEPPRTQGEVVIIPDTAEPPAKTVARPDRGNTKPPPPAKPPIEPASGSGSDDVIIIDPFNR